MKTVLSLTAAIALIGIAGVTAFAAQDGAAHNTKASLLATRAPAVGVEASAFTAERMCAKCSVPVAINEQVSTKPGHGTVQSTVFVDQCRACSSKMTTQLKQTEYVHSCTSHGCGA